MYIRTIVRDLIERHGTRNPFVIAKDLGIHLRYKYYTDAKGFYIKLFDEKFIIINSNLPDYEKRLVAAHELGHVVLHNCQGIYFLKENTLFPSGKIEREANYFAAELLIDDTDIQPDVSIQQISQCLGVPEELVKYKTGHYFLPVSRTFVRRVKKIG